MTGPEVTAAVERVGDAVLRWMHGEHADLYRPDLDAARDFLVAGLNVPQMAAAIVDHMDTDTLSDDSETLVCACGHVLVTGDPDDDRDPQAEWATHHAALIRAHLVGECGMSDGTDPDLHWLRTRLVEAVVTDAVRWACSNSLSGEKFDAWLAQHDREIQAQAFESGARSYAASDPCCGNYHLHEIENPHTGEAIPTREGEDDL